MNSNFLDNFVPDRVYLFKHDKNIDYIYQLLSKHTGKTLDQLKSEYKITAHWVRNRVFFSGDSALLFQLHLLFQKNGVRLESITNQELRVDTDELLHKLI